MKRGVQEPLSFEAYGGKHSPLFELDLNVTREKILLEKEGNRIPAEGNLMLKNISIQNSFIHSK